ncbi:MAG: WYL domain-containing protein [Bacteriovoracaceae bacterium]|nr:WYL domain-containing protein [Bacteriovoracaceae bacterium]
MSDKVLKLDALVWEQLAKFAHLESQKSWENIAQELGMSQTEGRRLMVAIKDAQSELLTRTGEGEDVFQAWNWSHWCQLTHILEEIVSREESKDLKPLIVPLLKQQRQHPAYPVYVQLRQRWQELTRSHKPFLVKEDSDFKEHKTQIIEEAILADDTILVECLGGKLLSLIPCKLTFLEGALTLIAEESHDHGLLALPLSEIGNIKRANKTKKARANVHEVSEFIAALRSMSESEMRLVLKIKNPEKFNLMPDYHFLGKPCLVTNAEGELIWAAWVEPCDELYSWIFEMDQHVEILEPSEFILDYAAFCEEKSRKMA